MEQKMRDRWLGAAVVLAIGALLTPWLLEKPQTDPFAMAEALPEAPRWPSSSAIIEAAKDLDLSTQLPNDFMNAASQDDEATLKGATPMDNQISSMVARVDKKSSGIKAAENDGARVAAIAVEAPAAAAYAVQLGLFSDQKNAKNLQDVLRKAGYAAYTVNVNTNKGVVSKVMVGPQTQRLDAEKVLGRLENDYQMKGIIVPFNPSKT